MNKYYVPTIKITSFCTENVVTEVSGVNQQYIEEVNTLIGNMTQGEYKVRVASVGELLQFTID